MQDEDLVRENELLRRRVKELEDLNRRLAKTEEDLRKSESRFRKTFEHAEIGRIVRQNDGKERIVRSHGLVVGDSSGRSVKMYGASQDITGQRKAEEEILKSERFLQATLDALDSSIAILDENGFIIAVNESWRRFSEDNGAQLPNDGIGFNYLEICDSATGNWSDGAPTVARMIKELLDGTSTDFGWEYPCHSPSEKRWFELSATSFLMGTDVRIVLAHKNITKRKEAEESLREIERKFRVLTETIDDVFWISTPGVHEMVYVSPAYEEKWGKTTNSLYRSPRSFLDVVHPDDRELLQSILLTKHSNGEPYSCEYRITPTDDSVVWIHERGFPIHDDRRRLRLMCGLCTDITDRKKAERRIARQQAQMELSQEMARIGYWTFDIATGTPAWSDMMFEVLGCDPANGVPQYDAHRDFIHPEDWDAFDAAVQGAIQGIPYLLDLRIVFPDGSIHYVTSQGQPQIDEEGVITSLFGVTQDISDRRKSEEALQKTCRRLDLALEAGNLGSWDWNTNTDEVYYDERWSSMLGYSPGEIEPHLSAWERLVHPEDMARVLGQVEDHAKGLTSQFKSEQRLKTKSGEWIWILSMGRVIERNEDGTAARILGIHVDISDRVKAEEDLKVSRDRLDQIVNFLPDPAVMIDDQGTVQFWNRAMEDLTGVEAESIIGKGDFEYALPFYGRRRPILLDLALNWDDTYEREYLSIVTLRDGVLQSESYHPDLQGGIFLSGTARVLYDSEGRANGAIETLRDITEVKLAENALRESEGRLAQIIEFLPDATMVIDVEGTVIGWNRSMEDLTGVQASTILGEADYAYALPFYHERRPVTIDLVLNYDEAIASRYHSICREADRLISEAYLPDFRDRGPTWLWITAVPLYDQDGRVVGAIETIRDVSERVQAEAKVRESEVLFGSVFASLQESVVIVTPEQTVKDANPATERMFGMNKEEIVGKSTEIFHVDHEHYLEFGRRIADVFNKGEIEQFEFELKRRNGEVFPSYHTVALLSDQEGKSIGMASVTWDLSESKKAAEDLTQSRKAFTNIVERSADGILVVDASGNVLYANHSATTLLGHDHDSLKKAPFGTPATSEEVTTIHIIRSDGEVRDVELRTALTDWFGQSARIVMLRDMTEWERHETALRQEKEKTEHYINVAGVLFVVLDANGNVVTVNRKTCEVLGRESDELVGRDWFSTALPKDIQDQVRQTFDHLMAGRLEPYEYIEAPVLTASGETRLVSWHNALLKDEKGAVFGTVSSGDDITERKEMERLLAESEERYRVLFERSSEAVLIARPNGEIITANSATARLFGVGPEDLTSLNVTEFYRNLDDHIAFRREVEAKGSVKNYPVEMKQRDGTEKLCVLSSSLWKDREGNIIGYLTMLLDVTEHRRLEEQLRQAQKLESVGTLAGGIAHDFNNILTVIQGYSEMVLADKSQDHPDYNDLSAVNSAAQRGAELVKQLMTFSRKVETDKRPVNLNKEVRTAVKLLSRTIPKMIHIQLHLAPDIRRIKADPGQIEQVIMNLAVNAKHAMPDGGTLTFETGNIFLDQGYCSYHGQATPGDYVFLMIEDTGQGMPKDVLDRIFEPFFSTKNPGEGTGLGLAMVYGIVKDHGGHVMCYSEPGMGTTFKMYFPVIEDVAASGEFKIHAELPSGAETILLVDDEEMIRALGRKMLELAGYAVMEAGTGEEALEVYRARGRKIDLVLLDLIMPGLGGHQALAELKKMDSDVRVIITSGYSPSGHAGTVIESGAAGFIAKPFRRSDVLRTVREILDR